jgi:hypothetical protein
MKMRLRYRAFSVLAGVLLIAVSIAYLESTPSMAEPLSVTLTGAQEVPPVRTLATAVSTITVAPDGTVTGVVDTMGIDGTMAHIHQGAIGVSGPVVVTLTQISPTRWLVPAGTKLTDAQLQSFKSGELYVNVHSAAHKSGEIRLQLTPTAGVSR